MTIIIVRDIDSFRALKNEWNALVEESNNSTLFLRWEWMFAYYQHLCADKELFLILVRNDEGELKGIAPFLLRRTRVISNKTCLEIIGQRHGYYLGIIVDSQSKDEACEEIVTYLFENRRQWDMMEFVNLSENDGFKLQLKCKAGEYGYFYKDSIKNSCKAIKLKISLDEYMFCLDKKFAKKMKYNLRSINRDFNVELSWADDEQTLSYLWHIFLDLHERRVHSKGGTTPLSNKDVQEFYYSIAKTACREGDLRLVGLKLNGQVAAVLFGIRWDKTFYFLNIGYEEHSKYSLGLVLPLLCIEKSLRDGLEWFDLLGGGGDYKERLGGVDRGGLNIQVMKPLSSLENVAASSAKRIARKLRCLGNKLCTS